MKATSQIQLFLILILSTVISVSGSPVHAQVASPTTTSLTKPPEPTQLVPQLAPAGATNVAPAKIQHAKAVKARKAPVPKKEEPAAPALAPNEVVFTLQKAIQTGIEYSPDLKIAESKVKSAVGGTEKAKGSLFPVINAVANANAHQNSGIYSSGVIPSYTSLNGELYQAGLTLTQPLYAGGGLVAGINLYKSTEEVARQGYFAAREGIIQNIISAFYGLAQSEELLDAATQNRLLLKAYLDVTGQYERIGRTRAMDRLQAQLNHSVALNDVKSNENLVAAATANLNRYLGLPSDKIIRTDFKVTISPVGDITLDQAMESAEKNNPTLKQQDILIEQVDYTEDLDLSQDNTSLNLVGSAGYSSPDRAQIFDSRGSVWQVGLNLTVPLFSGFSSRAKRRIYTETRVQGQKTLASLRNQTRAVIDSALKTLRNVEQQLFVTLDAVKQGRAALDLANKGYKQGIVSATDVVNLQNSRYNAEKLFVNTQYIYLNNVVNLRQAMGIDLEKAYENQ